MGKLGSRKRYIKLIIEYVQTYYISIIFFGYFVFAVILKGFSKIDITVPCPIYYTTGYKCHGCGLTTASTKVLRGGFIDAWHINPLVYLVLPLLGFLIIRHWIQFVNRSDSTNTLSDNHQQ